MRRIGIAVLALMLLCGSAWAGNTTVIAKNSAWNSASSRTYAGARDTTAASAASGEVYMAVGQRKLGDYLYVMRGAAYFPIASLSAASACTLWVWGQEDNSDTNFGVYVVGANSIRPTITKADYPLFDGRTAGGAHTGTILNDAWSTVADYTDEAYNALIFNAAGIDSLVAASGDTLWLAIISKEDYDNSAPTNDEYVVFGSNNTAGHEPYLSYTYTEPVVPVPKHGIYIFGKLWGGLKSSLSFVFCAQTAEAGLGPELVVDGGAESGVTAWTPHGTGSAVAQSDSFAHSGTYSCRLYNGATNYNAAKHEVATAIGKKYRVGVYVYVPSYNTATNNIVEFGTTSTLGNETAIKTVSDKDVWVYCTTDFVATVNPMYIWVYIGGNATKIRTLFIDDFSIREVIPTTLPNPLIGSRIAK